MATFSQEQLQAAMQVVMQARDQATEAAVNLALKLAESDAKVADLSNKLTVSSKAVEELSKRPAVVHDLPAYEKPTITERPAA